MNIGIISVTYSENGKWKGENMEKSELKSQFKHRIKTASNKSPIVLDGKASKKVPTEPSLMERTKEAMENIGTEINNI